MVEKAKQQGILAYNLAISPDQIEQEEYIQITTCYKCYEMDDHLTHECPHSKLTTCSECGELGHTFRNCTKEGNAALTVRNITSQQIIEL